MHMLLISLFICNELFFWMRKKKWIISVSFRGVFHIVVTFSLLRKKLSISFKKFRFTIFLRRNLGFRGFYSQKIKKLKTQWYHSLFFFIVSLLMTTCSIIGLQQEVVLEKGLAQNRVSRLRKHFLKDRKYYQLEIGSILVADPKFAAIREISNDCYEIFCLQCGFGFRIYLQNGFAVAQKLHYKNPEKKNGKSILETCPFQIRGILNIVDVKQYNIENFEPMKQMEQNNNTVSLLMCYSNKEILTQSLDFPLYIEWNQKKLNQFFISIFNCYLFVICLFVILFVSKCFKA